MATTGLDIDAYFASKQPKSVEDKLTALSVATRNKLAGLQAFKAEADQWRVQRAVDEELSKNSWAGKLGLEQEGVAANAVNGVASVVAGTSRLAGHIASLPVNAGAMVSTLGATQQEYDAYNRSLAGTSLAGDGAILDTARDGGLSARARFENAEVLRKKSRGINETMDLSKIVEQTNRNNLNKDLGEGFDANWGKITSGKVGDTLAGVAGLAANTGSALLSNPMGVGEYVLENAPQLLVGALGKAGQVAMASSNAGYAADVYQQGIEAYAKKNGGQLPPEEQRERMSLQAAALALAEQGGDMAGLALAGLKKKAASELVKTSFKESLKNVTKAGTGAFTTESLTEAGQTYLEGEITGKPATAKDIYIAGAIGGASGASLSGGVRTLAEISGATAEQAAVRQQTVIAKEVLEAAGEKGDVTSYMDKTSPNYSPGKAVEVLFKHSQKADTTPEQRDANTAKADEIVDGLETERLSAERNLALSTIAGTKQAISDYEKRLSEMEPNDPDREGVLAAIDVYQGNLVDKETKGENPLAVKDHREKLAQLDGQLEQVNRSRAALNIFNKRNDDVASLVSIADTDIETVANGEQDAPAVGSAPRAEATESVNKLITLAMRSPEKVSDAQARQLADNPKNGLTEAQRTYLRALSEERVAENVLKTMDNVGVEIAQGGKGFIGMAQHRTALRAALAAGNEKVATSTIQTLSKFSASHSGKAAAANAAEKGDQVLKSASGEWFVATPAQRIKSKNTDLIANRAEVDALVRKSGGFTKNSDEMVLTIQDEAAALKKMLATANAAFVLKFDTTTTTPTTGADNVPNTPQRVPAQSGQVEAQAAKTTKAVEPGGEQGTVVPGEGKPTAVETAGVDLGSRDFNSLTDPDEKINLYRGEGPGNIADGAWWSFDKENAEQYAKSSGGKVLTKVMLAKDIANQTAQGHLSPRHRVFPSKADVGVIGLVKEAPASSVVTKTAKETEVTQSTEKTEVNSTSDEETEFELEDRLKKEADVLEAARTAKVTDLDRRIALLEKLKTCMGG